MIQPNQTLFNVRQKNMTKVEDIEHKALAYTATFLDPGKIFQSLREDGVDEKHFHEFVRDGISRAAMICSRKSEKLKRWQLAWDSFFYIGAALTPALALGYDYYRYLPLALLVIGVCRCIVTKELHELDAKWNTLSAARNLYEKRG